MKDPMRSANARRQPRTPSGRWAAAMPFGAVRAPLSVDERGDVETIGRECRSGRLDGEILDAMGQAGVDVDRDRWERDPALRAAVRDYYAQRYAEAYRS